MVLHHNNCGEYSRIELAPQLDYFFQHEYCIKLMGINNMMPSDQNVLQLMGDQARLLFQCDVLNRLPL